MNYQVHSIVMEFLIEGDNPKEIRNFALVNISGYTPAARIALSYNENLHLRCMLSFYKRDIRMLAEGAKQFLSHEALVTDYFRCYIRTLTYGDDGGLFLERFCDGETLERMADRILSGQTLM